MEALDALVERGSLILGQDGRAWIGWGEARRQATPDSGKLSLYSPDFFLRDPRPWLVYDESAHVATEPLIAGLDRLAASSARPEWRTSPYPEFHASFEGVQREIAQGTLTKAVPFISRKARFAFDRAQRAATLANALRTCRGEALLAYGVWDEHEGLIGTTPETLFVQRECPDAAPSLATMALAGTRAPGKGSLLNDPKEVLEHRVVVDGIVERLAPLGRVEVGRTRELELPRLVHLHTPIEAFPEREVGFADWVAALHPTAAIGAWPKAAGWCWLQEQPNASERGRYGAPFGVVPPDAATGFCLVAIRNVQWSGDEARILAGGGIVAASQADREWREFNAKLDSIQGALGL